MHKLPRLERYYCGACNIGGYTGPSPSRNISVLTHKLDLMTGTLVPAEALKNLYGRDT